MSEKRRAARERHDSAVELFDSEGRFITGIGRLTNVSSTGACFSTPKILPADEPLRLRLRLLREGPLEITAHIVWSRKNLNTRHYGIVFDSVQKTK